MTDYLTEEEQVAQLKRWVKEYGLTVLLGVVLAFIIVSGWNYWQSYRTKNLLHASAIYDEMLTLIVQNNSQAVTDHAQKLIKHYSNTPYAQMAALALARQAIALKQYGPAQTQLNWVITHSKNPAIREIARLRAARISITEKKPDAALTLLATVDDKSFNSLINEIKGDAYLELQNKTAAKHSYQLALQELPNAAMLRPILQMKYDDLITPRDPYEKV